MGVSFVLMFFAGIICAIAPQILKDTNQSYYLFAVGRFLLACATRGISITGFVMGKIHLNITRESISFLLIAQKLLKKLVELEFKSSNYGRSTVDDQNKAREMVKIDS